MPAEKMQPTPYHPDDEPLVCVRLNAFWIPYLVGALKPMRYPEYWLGTLEENRQARRDTGNLIYQLETFVECGDDPMAVNYCCVERVIERRINPLTLQLEISIDGGDTWTQDPQSPITTLIAQPPPVTAGVMDDKCDAATNGQQHIEDIIQATSTNLETAGTVAELAIAICEAILGIILYVASAGALAPLAIALATAFWAALTGVFELGLEGFNAYWTSIERDKILCNLYCNLSDDGSFDQVGYDKFLTDWKNDATPSIAFNMVYSAVKAVGLKGMNNMCAYGNVGEGDCSSCDCEEPCELSHWSIDPSEDNTNGQIDSFDVETGDLVLSSTIAKSDGKYYIVVSTSRVYGANTGCFCNTNVVANFEDKGVAWQAAIPSGGLMQNHCVNHFGLVQNAPFTQTINLGDCP
jgi:hypothetical protein